jgi:hypothetical protein
MIDQRMEELMWLEIEGKISGGDRAALQRYLESNGDARGYFNDALRMAALFRQTGELNPPSELRERILRALENTAPPRVLNPRPAGRFGSLFSPGPVWRYAAAGVLGIVIGIAGYHLVRNGNEAAKSVDIKHFYGSIAGGGEDFPGSSLEFDLPAAKGTLAVRRTDANVLSKLAIDSTGDIEIVVGYPGAPIEIAAGQLSERPSNQVAIEDREVHVRNRGKGTYHILFSLHEDPASPVKVRVLSEGSVLLEKEISPSRVPDKG